MAYEWHLKPFGELTPHELYALLRLRTDVFVVEQACPYPELDGKDGHPETLHLWYTDADGAVAACLRLLAPGVSHAGVSMGRVAVHASCRGSGLGHEMVDKAVELAGRFWPGMKIEIGAQEYLTAFYKSHGFRVVSAPYLEDNILHIDMVLNQT